MKLQDLLAGIPLKGESPDCELEINSITCDPQDAMQGALYVQTPGSPLPAARALERGAAAAVCAGPGQGGCLGTEYPWQTLALLGANWYCHPGSRMTLVAVAGSGDCELVAHLLGFMLERMPHIRVGAITPRSAWIGGVELPAGQRGPGGLCVQRLLRRMADERCTHVVLQLDDGALARREFAGLRMSVTALTGPTPEKDGLSALLRGSDMVVFNLDERGWEDYRNIIPEYTFTYSENKTQADLVARNLRLYPGHMEFEAVTVGHIQRIHLPVPGGFALYHGLCVFACGICLGLKRERMARTLRCAHGPGGRMEVLPASAAYTVVLDRADTPGALERLLTCVRDFTAGQLICVLSCSDDVAAELRPELGGVAEQLADRLILTGSGEQGTGGMEIIREVLAGTGEWGRPCTVEPDRRRAIRMALEQAGPGDVVVLAGEPNEKKEETGDEREFVRGCIRRGSGRRINGVWTGV